MTIMLIDDLRNFRPESGIVADVVARTSKGALEYLNQFPDTEFKEIWLDHDLGGDDTIMVVVDYLNERAFFDNPVNVETIYVHSSNPVGVRQMLAGLERYGYVARRVDAAQFFIV